MGLKVGLDFGTSNSGVAISNREQVWIIPIEKSNVLPEVVKTILYITRDHQHFIGQEAVELYYQQNVNRMRRYAKKWAGEIEYHGSDGMFYVQDVFVDVDELQPGRLLQYLKTTLRNPAGPSSYLGTKIFGQYYSVGDLVKAYLAALKQRAEDVLEDKIIGVTLGRPVQFSDSKVVDQMAEETLSQAAYEAGFQEVDFEFEPIAAALYYERTLNHPQNVLIFDFGGGTLDIAILRLGDTQNRKIYSSGGIGIAGSDFDRAIIGKRLLPHFGLEQANHLPELLELIQAIPDWAALPEFSTPKVRHNLEQAIQQGIAPARLKALQSLIFNDLAFSFYNRVEQAKIALSSLGTTTIELNEPGIDLWELYTRAQFEKDILAYQIQIEKVLLDTVTASGLELGDIDAVVKTGGSSNIPVFTSMLRRIFGYDKVVESNTFGSVVAGLAIKAVTI